MLHRLVPVLVKSSPSSPFDMRSSAASWYSLCFGFCYSWYHMMKDEIDKFAFAVGSEPRATGSGSGLSVSLLLPEKLFRIWNALVAKLRSKKRAGAWVLLGKNEGGSWVDPAQC